MLDRTAVGIRWIARVLDLFLVLLVAAIVIGEGVSHGLPHPYELTPREIVLFAAFFTMLLGVAVAGFREGLGGAVIVGGFVLFWIVNFTFSQGFWIGWVFPLFLLAGLMHLFCWWRIRIG